MRLDGERTCVTDLGFDRWFAGEHTPEGNAAIDAHLSACARCRVRGELLGRERAAFLERAPTLAAHERFVRPEEPAPIALPSRSTRVALWLVAAAVVGLAVITPWPAAREQAGERRKGGFGVGFYVKRGERVMRGSTDEAVHPGDLLRFTYSSDAPAYWALLGRDAQDASVYFPASRETARLPAGRDQPLDFSLELDEQLGVERLFVVACPRPYPLEPLRRALLSEGDPRAPAECRVERIALRKEAP